MAILKAKALKVLEVDPVLSPLKQDILRPFCPFKTTNWAIKKMTCPAKQEESRQCPEEAEEPRRKNKLSEAKIVRLEGAHSGVKRGSSPMEQALTATSIKRARLKKGQKGYKSTDSEASEDLLKPMKDMVGKAIVEHGFAIIKFTKGPGAKKKLASHCLHYDSSTKLKKKERTAWFLNFGDLCVGELNNHQSIVQTAIIKGQFRVKWVDSPTRDIGTMARWEACLNRDLDMNNNQDRADFSFCYNNLMDKATGTNTRWNECHGGYVRLCDGHPPLKIEAIDHHVMPEMEAYGVTVVKAISKDGLHSSKHRISSPSARSSPSKSSHGRGNCGL